MYWLKDIKTQFCKTGPRRRKHGFFAIFFLATVFSCISQWASAQEKGLPFIKNYSPNEYQSHRQNWAIVQGNDGLMYFGNGKGVLEFDGASWRLIMLPNRGHVRSLAVGRDGTIYVGGNGDFGYLAPDEKGLLQFISLLSHVPEDERDFGRIWTVVDTGHGKYFQSYNRLFRWKDGKIKSWHFETHLHRIFAFDDIIYATDTDVGFLRLEDDKFRLLPGSPMVKGNKVDVMLPTEKSKFLLGTRRGGFFLFDGHSIVKHDIPANDTLKTLGIYKVAYLPDGDLAVASNFGGGVAIIDKNSGAVKQFLNETTGIKNNNVLNIFVDRQNALWLGMQEGIARVELSAVFSVFDKRLGLQGTIQDIIRHEGTIFAGTSVGLYKLESGTKGNHRFVPVPNAPYYVWDMQSFGDQLLIGTTYGTYSYQAGKVSGIKYYNVTTSGFYPSKFEKNTIWQAIDVGLVKIKWENGKWVEQGQVRGISGAVRGIVEADRGELWLHTKSNGLFQVIVNAQSGFDLGRHNTVVKHFNHEHGVPIGENALFLIHNEIFIRSENNLLSRFNRNTNRFEEAKGFTEKFGMHQGQSFPKQNVQENGNIWLGHYSKQDKSHALVYAEHQPDGTYRAKSYEVGQALDRFHDPFHPNVFHGEKNAVWIGGMNGIVLMEMNEVGEADDEFNVLVRKISNQQDSLFFIGHHVSGEKVEFAHKHNALRIEYSVPYYQNEGQNQFQCMLEGFDRQWSAWTTETRKDYTNLWEGDYNFKVRAKNSFGQVSDIASFSFSIDPPWHRTLWAYALYIAGLIVLVAGIVRWRSRQLEQDKLQLEKIVSERTEEVRGQAEKLKELDIMKSRFFANISHEFRTPLTLILAPLKKLLSGKPEARKGEGAVTIGLNTAKLMERNADRLLRLINQLLDLSKLESGNMILEIKRGDILQFIRDMALSFTALAEYKKISYNIDIPPKKLEAYFDLETVEKIVYNLLSNAFKFTAENGKIAFTLLVENHAGVGREGLARQVKIIVRDSGKGIPRALKGRIFERFYQVDGTHTREQEGSGIGLALTKELVELHHGDIAVESEEGKGTVFTVCLPIDRSSFKAQELVGAGREIPFQAGDDIKAAMIAEATGAVNFNEKTVPGPGHKEKPMVLLVEDSGDVRFFMKDNLKGDYNIKEAVNGEQGLEFALKTIPDLIITDLMMPKMDGIELCKALKANEVTSHVPVIMLTARSNIETRLEGLQTGADDYITKPFNVDELRVRVLNLITQRRKLRERFSREINFEPKEIAVSSVDEKFLEKVLSLMEENLDDPEFGVPAMQLEVGMSKTQLHRKFKALTDQSPGEFMRNFRLKRAAQILSKQGGNVTEVSYQVGFNNLSYFAKCFKDLYGESPSQYGASHAQPGTKV